MCFLRRCNANRRWIHGLHRRASLRHRVSGTYLSDRVFAVDYRQGKPRWVYDGKRISNNAIAIGDGILYLIDPV